MPAAKVLLVTAAAAATAKILAPPVGGVPVLTLRNGFATDDASKSPVDPSAESLCQTWSTDPASCLRRYNVAWDALTPSDVAAKSKTWIDTMPLGNGKFAANVWAENTTDENGSIHALLSASGAWLESGELAKVGHIKISIKPNPFADDTGFRQEFDVPTGSVIISTYSFRAELLMPTGADVLLASISSPDDTAYAVSYEVLPIRPAVPSSQQPPFDCVDYVISPDIIDNSAPQKVFYHRNPSQKDGDAKGQSYYLNVMRGQNLYPEGLDAVGDGLADLTFGGAVGDSFGDANELSRVARRVSISLAVGQPLDEAELAAFVSKLKDQAARHAKNATALKDESDQWWLDFHYRSHIEIASSGPDRAKPFNITRQFVLERILTAFQARDAFPIKFNGQLFTANKPKAKGGKGVDYRQWGGLNWWQNLRSPYYSMLSTGDADLLCTSLLESFLKTLDVAKARVQKYYNHSGAMWIEYTHPLFGTTHPNTYGCKRPSNWPKGYWDDRFNHYNFQGGLDLSLFVLDHFAWTEDEKVLKRYLPIVESSLEFFSHRWEKNGLDANGKMILYPTQSLETWKCPGYPPNATNCARNDMPSIAGLRSVLERVLALPEEFVSSKARKKWEALLGIVPDLPTVGSNDQKKLAPADKLPPSPSNVENAELYAIHPHRLITASRKTSVDPGLDVAIRSYRTARFRSDVGWHQNAPESALLGLGSIVDVQSAPNLVSARAAYSPAEGYRFPAFMPHFQDYEPSADHLGMFANAVVGMVLQPADDEDGSAVVLPAFPCGWDVDFKVWGPKNTLVEGVLKRGNLKYVVQPEERMGFVSARNCQW